MERFLVWSVLLSLVISVCFAYTYDKLNEFQTFTSDFETQLEADGTTKFLDMFYHERLTTEFGMFKFTDTYKELDRAYRISVKEEYRNMLNSK